MTTRDKGITLPFKAPFINVKDAPYSAKGDGVTDDTAALQSALNAAAGGRLYIPKGIYKITSQLYVGTPIFSVGQEVKIFGDGVSNSIISVSGNITGLMVEDSAGTKGGISDVGFINSGNTYSGGGVVVFNYPNSIGIKIRDVFQFCIENVVCEQFGTGLQINNYNAWSEGTYTNNFWARNNKIGIHFLREYFGTDSFSHTQFLGFKVQIPKDSASGKWQTGLKVEGLPAGAGAAQIYNGYLQGNLWTGDSIGTGINLAEYVYLTNKGRISQSFLALSFERFGKFLIDDTSYISESHTFLSSVDPSQISFTDNNTSKNSKFRSQYKGNINQNLVNMSIANWQGMGSTATMRQGMQDSTAVGFHFGVGLGLSFPFVTSLTGSGNGFFYGTTPDYEDNVTWRFKVDHNGDIFPRLAYSALTSGNGAPASLSTGYTYMRADSDKAVDSAPLWVGIGSTVAASLQVSRVITTAQRPSAPVAGQMFFDSTVGKPIWWSGTNWKDATGTNV